MDVKKAINNFDSCFSTKKINEKRQSIHQQKKTESNQSNTFSMNP